MTSANDLPAVVVVEGVGPDVGDVEIDEPVVVVVGRAGAHAVLGVRDAGPRRRVFEGAVAAVPEEPVARAPGRRRIDERSAVHEKDVLPAVAVVVEEQAAAAHDFRKMAGGAGAVDVAEVDAGARRDVDEAGRGRLRLRGWRARGQ